MVVNNGLGLGFSVIGNVIGLSDFLEYSMTFISPLILTFLGGFMYFRLTRLGKRDNHQADPITLKVKKNIVGIFLLGILTGLPPCPFEFAVYVQALEYGSKFFVFGFFYVFWFSVGTVLGLFILAAFSKSIGRLQALNEKRDIVERVIAILLLCFGILSFTLAVFQINFFPQWPPPPPVEEI
ncbi:MAG: sulfite exporter TauE/SafE family protein [Candidatus Hodarchaeota archaeon]